MIISLITYIINDQYVYFTELRQSIVEHSLVVTVRSDQEPIWCHDGWMTSNCLCLDVQSRMMRCQGNHHQQHVVVVVLHQTEIFPRPLRCTEVLIHSTRLDGSQRTRERVRGVLLQDKTRLTSPLPPHIIFTLLCQSWTLSSAPSGATTS